MTDQHRCVVRLSTSWWRSSRGLHERRDLIFLRRQCAGYNILEEDAKGMSAEEVVTRVVDWSTLKDGVYEVTLANQVQAWETGGIEDYDYQLVEVEP